MSWRGIGLSVVLGLVVVSHAQTTRSVRTCSELPAFPAPESFGSARVCGGSKISAFGTCVDEQVSFSEADSSCKKIGARLCTSQELANNEAKGSGCGLDMARVWSSTSLGCSAGATASQAGSGDFLKQHPIQCTDNQEQLAVRCCADVFEKPCAKNECSSRENIQNVCVPAESSHTCVCGGEGWTSGAAAKSCNPPSDPCLALSDPCKLKQNQLATLNQCVRTQTPPFYRCACATGYKALTSPPQCVDCNNPCENSDPCGTKENSNNKCVLGNGFVDGCRPFVCECGIGYVAANNKQNCQACGNPCAASENRCSQAEDANNVCTLMTPVNGQCATYVCSCGGNAFVDVPSRDSCKQCANPCLDGSGGDPKSKNYVPPDPCKTLDDPSRRNQCKILRLSTDGNGCPTEYQCSCLAPGYLTTPAQKSCRFCTDPCQVQSDPCKLRAPPASASSRTNNNCQIALLPKDLETGDCPSGRLCSCSPPYVLSADRQSCLTCTDLCRADPCNSKGSAGNKCTLVDSPGACPTKYECSCAAGWLNTGTGCLDCKSDPCAGNSCRSNMNKDNVCKYVNEPGKCPTKYECVCQGTGFLLAADKQSCTACDGPCDSNPCDARSGNQNKCMMKYGPRDDRSKCPTSYSCSCPFPSIVRVQAGKESCVSCEDPCARGDPCGTKEDPTNVCNVIRGPTDGAGDCPTDFVCQCAPFPWLAVNAGKACMKCADPCEKDPCLSGENEANQCQIRYVEGQTSADCPASFFCRCDGFGYITAESQQACTACQDPCVGDPCSNNADSLNRCVPLVMPFGSNRCASFTCQCHYPNFSPSADGKACIACPSACDVGDPCNIATYKYNECQVARAPTDLGTDCPSAHICTCKSPSVAAFDRQSCLACKDVCAGDPCSTELDERNMCKPAYVEGDTTCPSSFRCTCGGDFKVAFNQQACEICRNPCLGDPCNSAADPRNKCTVISGSPGQCDQAACLCGGSNFFPDVFGRSCQVCPNPCAQDPCAHNPRDNGPFSPLNTCTQVDAGPGTCGGYKCNCRGEGWKTVSNTTQRWNGKVTVTEDLQTCQLCADPCLSDPCNSKADPKNRCEPFGGAAFAIAEAANRRQAADTKSECGGFRCVCGGDLWIAPVGAQKCIACLNPCDQAADPCNSKLDPNNRCVLVQTAPGGVVPAGPGWVACSTYKCECNAVGWVSPAGAQTCQACPDPCKGVDPCGTAFDSKNLCIVSGALPNLSLLNRPSDSAGGRRRMLQNGMLRGNTCPGYTCQCGGAGWMTPTGKQSCQPCPNPCRTGDPCNRKWDQRNTCVPLSVPVLRGRRLLQNKEADVCGGYSCECAEGWITGLDKKSCLACPSPCQNSNDPCKSGMDPRNTCTAMKYIPKFDGQMTAQELSQLPANLEELCGGYTCKCDGEGWLTASNKQTCTACPNPCDSDPCKHAANDRNVCVPDVVPFGLRRQGVADKCGGYTCVCGGADYFAPAGAQSCSLCNNPCAGDPCYTSVDPKNKCEIIPSTASGSANGHTTSAKCGSYVCRCAGAGWLTGLGSQSCDVCPDPCKDHDPCSTADDRLNLCVPDTVIPVLPKKPTTGRRLLQVGGFPSLYNTRAIASQYGAVIGPAPRPSNLLPLPVSLPVMSPVLPSVSHVTLPAVPVALRATSVANIFAQCGGYTCKCDGVGYMKPLNSESCQLCPDPCVAHNDPCRTFVDGRNRCLPDIPKLRRQSGSNYNTCGGYTCTCASTGWLQPADGQSCEPCPNPCLSNGDPCSRNKDNNNICIPDAPDLSQNGVFLRRSHEGERCGGYTCKCGSGWVTPDDKQSCQRCPNPCDGIDPCNNREDPRNICVPDYLSTDQFRRSHEISGVSSGINYGLCGGYTCQCGGAGWVAPPGAKSCSACPNPCLNGDPCAVNTDSRNYCLPHYEPNNPKNRRQANRPRATDNTVNNQNNNAESRQFLSPNIFGPNVGPPLASSSFVGNAPVLFSNPVAEVVRSPFVPAAPAAWNYDNSMNPLGRCGVYKCECGAPGWMSTANNLGCVRCPDPCLSAADPCGVRAGYNNKCVRTTSPINLAFDMDDPTRKCGGFTCDCGPGFIQSSDGKRCDPCPNPCLGRDPCATAQHPNNRCIPDNLGQYAKVPSGNAINGVFIQGAGLAQQAAGQVGPGRRLMSHDDFGSPAYYYQGGQCGGYVCQCAGPLQGWIAPTEKRACIPCNNPCQTSDPCSSTIDSRNVCIPIAATGAGGPSDCGSYTCRCNGVGFIPSTGGQSCRTCPNPCQLNDPCNTRMDPNNVCTPNYVNQQVGNLNAGGCGNHICTCNGAGWMLGERSATCLPKPAVNNCFDPCLEDPCNSALNPGNRCINQANVQCGYYQCQCASGWTQIQPVVTQGPTCQLTGVRAGGSNSNQSNGAQPPAKTPVSNQGVMQGPPVVVDDQRTYWG